MRPLQFGRETRRSTERVASYRDNTCQWIHCQPTKSEYIIVGGYCFLDLSTLSGTNDKARKGMPTLYLLPRSVPGREHLSMIKKDYQM
jgi:hypothetical protein